MCPKDEAQKKSDQPPKPDLIAQEIEKTYGHLQKKLGNCPICGAQLQPTDGGNGVFCPEGCLI